ncbi:sigma factor-like helix-turn-helix DNA-binding protein, partial [Clostridium sp.]
LEAINKMNSRDKEIFIRRYFLYEGIENIAKSFGVDRGLVDKRLSRGRKFLKEKLIVLKGEVL